MCDSRRLTLRRLANVTMICGLCALAPHAARAALKLDASTVRNAPAGVHVGAGVSVEMRNGQPAGIRFAETGIEFALDDALSARSGTATIRLQVPTRWPSTERATLLHVGDRPHLHVTIFFQDGRLIAVYKGGEEHYASIDDRRTVNWQPGSRHVITLSWRSTAEAVELFLTVDDTLVGRQVGHLIQQWPKTGYVGVRRAGQSWKGTIESAQLSTDFQMPAELRPGRRSITINADQPVGDCYDFWSISNFTSQHMFADPRYGTQVKQQKPFMRYVNCVRLLGGRHDGRNQWFRGIGANGHVDCDFTGLIQYLRGIRQAGYTPRIVLDNIPTAMSEPGELAKYGNTRPAKDLDLWHAYIQQAVTAMVTAFGKETVAAWRFRVGTEPDLNPGHWQGTKEEYLRHYDCTVDAVCAVIPNAEIGPGNVLNPATAEANAAAGRNQWGLDIVDHCAQGKNFWTGTQGTRMCFLECSWYGRVGRSIDSFDVAIQRMRDRLRRYPQFAYLPISVAEFAILNDEYGRRLFSGDITEWGASWYAAVAERVYALDVWQVHEWAQTTAGIPHPRTLVIGLLAQMQGGQRLQVDVQANSSARAGAIASLKQDKLYVLVYNHRPWRSPAVDETIDLTIHWRRLADHGQWAVKQKVIDNDHGVFVYQFYADCAAAGIEPLPNSPLLGGNVKLRFGNPGMILLTKNRAQYAALAKLHELPPRSAFAVSGQSMKMTIKMPGHSVRLLEISAQ